MTQWLPISGWSNRVYSGPSTIVHDIHRCNLFLPNYKDGVLDPTIPVPPNGWPCVVYPIFGAWQISFIADIIDDTNPTDSVMYSFLKRGYAIISATLAVLKDPAALAGVTLNPHSDIKPFNRNTSAATEDLSYGINYPAGNGLWLDLQIDTSANLAIHPLRNPNWFNSAKSFVMLTQHIIQNGQSGGLDINSLYCHSNSAGMWSIIRAIWGEEMSLLMFTAPQGQELVTVRGRYKGGYLRQSPSWWPVFNPSSGISLLIPFMPVDPNKVAAIPSDPVPFEGWDVPDNTWLLLSDNSLEFNSILDWALNPAVIEGNKQGRFVLSYNIEDDVGPPYDKTNFAGTSVKPHSIWGGIALYKGLNKAHPLIVEVASIATGEYTTIIEDGAELLNYVIAYWEEASGYTFPYVPKIKKTPTLYQESKSKVLVEFKYGNPSFPKYERYTTGLSKSFEGNNLYSPYPTIEIDFKPRTMDLDGSEGCTITIKRNSWTAELFDLGEAISPVHVVVREILTGITNEEQILYLFTGYLSKRTFVSESKVKLEFLSYSSQINGELSVRLDTQCDNSLGDFICGVDLSLYATTATIISLDDALILVDTLTFNPQNQPGDNGFYRRGYIEYDGLRISIKDWNAAVPGQFLLVQEPPQAWLNKIVTVKPGCDFKYDTCGIRFNNQEKFLGLGVSAPSYQAFLTGGDKTPKSVNL